MPLPDIDDLDSVGGAKINLHEVANPETDEDAAHRNIAFADAVMATRTLTRTWVKLTTVNGANPTLDAHHSVWGTGVPLNPVLVRTGEGVITITFPASVQDELGNAHAVNLRAGSAGYRGTTARFVHCEPTAPNVLTLYTHLANGTADDIPGTVIDVLAI